MQKFFLSKVRVLSNEIFYAKKMHVHVCFWLQLWLMKGQIEEQHGKNIDAVREAYKNGVSVDLCFIGLYVPIICL